MTYFLRHESGMELRCESKWKVLLLQLKGYKVMYEIKDFGRKK